MNISRAICEWWVLFSLSFISLFMSHGHFLSPFSKLFYSNLIFLILKWPNLAFCFNLIGPGKIILWDYVIISFYISCVILTVLSSFYFFFTVLKVRWNLCLITLIPFSPDFFYCLWIIYSYFFSHCLYTRVFWIYCTQDGFKKLILTYAFTRMREFCILIV